MSGNPWHKIKVENYENHMGHPNVLQLQMLNNIIKQQIETIPKHKRSESVVSILGITNGNGLEHIKPLGIKKVIGIDINKDFLSFCKQHYNYLEDSLCLKQIDLIEQRDLAVDVLKEADLIIANLLIEHVGLENFTSIIKSLPRHNRLISCVIQVNPDGKLSSASGYEHAFDEVIKIVDEVDENSLILKMKEIKCTLKSKASFNLPNGKLFLQLDFESQS